MCWLGGGESWGEVGVKYCIFVFGVGGGSRVEEIYEREVKM